MPDTAGNRTETWATMPLAARDAAYNNQLAVGADKAKVIVEAYVAASRRLADARPQLRGLAYGSGEHQKIDLYPGADRQAPCLVFIFGGYWQRNSRESFACVAEGVLAHGWSAAFPGYTLAPQASLTDIVGEIRSALDWLGREGQGHGIAGPLVLSGWSAGGHLTATCCDHPAVAAALPVSGVFDLGPLRDVPSVNDEVRLSEIEVETLSPLRLAPVAKPVAVAYGSAELPALVASSRSFHAYRADHHCPGALIPVPGADHFTVLDEFRSPTGLLTRAALRLAEDLSDARQARPRPPAGRPEQEAAPG